MSVDLSERYGTRRPRQRLFVVVVCAVLAIAFLGWLGWVMWFHSTPEASSDLSTYSVVDQHKVEVVVQVHLSDDADATCKVRALAGDHVTVGEQNFTPTDGRNEVSIRTEREATSVELVGCTTPDQDRPR
ncbi:MULTISPECIES: DUF4307 domain-containing protein [unclassified Nocardioides]|uniref:DUF4307 domain-containing protein n=1 Tax=unclassified Nocardioides TaxID=2615069 RepID=UPI0006F4CD36|nr:MULTISPECIES: DUF4307 domain-containing protein [unclassified Nocardioides]KQY64629.1 hypothetical protein ASD30_06885 [Nocardioides sp. Root140]KRF12533.1 hypothetical protein ASH02_13240 [Nocardioides sp. Soil796]